MIAIRLFVHACLLGASSRDAHGVQASRPHADGDMFEPCLIGLQRRAAKPNLQPTMHTDVIEQQLYVLAQSADLAAPWYHSTVCPGVCPTLPVDTSLSLLPLHIRALAVLSVCNAVRRCCSRAAVWGAAITMAAAA